MLRRTSHSAALTGVAMSLLSGCMPEMTMEDMAKMRPARPAELDKLNMWVGNWQGAGEAKMMGFDGLMKSTSTTEVAWDDTGWYLVEKGEYAMEDMKINMHAFWTYDPKSKKYRTWMFDDWGGQGYGTAKYCPEGNCWCFKAKARSAFGSTKGRGCAKFIDDNTVEFTWAEWPGWDIFRLFKVMEVTGTNTRR